MSYKIILIFLILLVSTCSNGYSESGSTLFDNGIADFQKGRYQDAVFWFTKLIENEPFNAKAYMNRGVARLSIQEKDMAMGNNEESQKAMEDFNSALNLDPELEEIHSNMGVAWYYAKEYKKAIAEYDKEIGKNPENHSASFNRAICWMELKEYQNALKDLQSVLEAKPNEYWAIAYQGDIYAETNNLVLARGSYLAAIALNTGDEYAQDRLLLLDEKVTAPAKIKNSQPFAEETEKLMAQSVSQAGSNSIKTEDTVILKNNGVVTSTVSIKEPSPSLKKISLKKISLKKVNLKKINLKKINLKKINLKKISLKKINLKKINLKKVNLKKISLKKISLKKISLKKISLKKISLKEVNLKKKTDLPKFTLQ